MFCGYVYNITQSVRKGKSSYISHAIKELLETSIICTKKIYSNANLTTHLILLNYTDILINVHVCILTRCLPITDVDPILYQPSGF